MQIKKPAVFAFSLLTTLLTAQEDLYVKGNVALLPLGILHGGVEKRYSEHITWQADALLSPWRSVAEHHARAFIAHVEGRYYPAGAFRHFFTGVTVGGSAFDITKWNYFDQNVFQQGFNYMVGATIGYQWKWRDGWNVEVFLSGGNQQGFYKPYTYDSVGNVISWDHSYRWNKSGEWIPFRSGIMLSYQLK